MELSHRIRKLRLERDLTQDEVAKPRYTAAYVSTIEAGRRRPSQAALKHFAAKLGVGVEELTSGRHPGARAKLLSEYGAARKLFASGKAASVENAERQFEHVAESAKKDGFVDIAAKARVGSGLCAEARSELERALRIYDETLGMLEDEGPQARVDALVGRVRVLQTQGELAHAAFIIEKAIFELEAAGVADPAALVRLHTALVAAYFDAGLVEQASSSAAIALELATAVTDAERLADMNLNVGIALAQQGHWRDAETRLAEAARWFDELQYATDLARVRLVRGINLRNQSQFDEGREHLEAARRAFAEAGNELREARATVALGVLERAAGRIDEARFLLKSAIALAGEDHGVAGIARRELALCDADKNTARCLSGLREAISLLEEAGLVRELALTYRHLGDLLSRDKELAPACDAYRQAADLFERAA